MGLGRLTALQERLLEVLAPIEPRWTLTGGGALSGFHLGHRETRDLDLFWHGESLLGDMPRLVADRLRAVGLTIEPLHGGDSFRRFKVSDGTETTVLDLVAEPTPPSEPPAETAVRSVRILVDTRHEILVNKLCSLLGRLEYRDLLDLRELLLGGGDLTRALVDAARKDGGFSPPTLAWLLSQIDLNVLARQEDRPEVESESLKEFLHEFTRRLVNLSRPE